jgi:predicted nucleic acid-binding protein
MVGGGRKKQLALDTNVLVDLAERKDAAHSLRATFQQRGYLLLITPTVVAELDALSYYGEPAQQTAAHRALNKLFEWSIKPLVLATIQKDIAESFAKRLPLAGLLPGDEFNDGLILAESSLAEIPLLVTSDKHLLDIDETALRLAFHDADLLPVSPVHPRRLLRALR